MGESLRRSVSKLPAMVNCTLVDCFQPWPEDALLSVASKLLTDV